MPDGSVILAVVGAIVGIPGLMTALHMSILAAGAVLYRERLRRDDVPPVRFLVVVPAHNEELVLGRTLGAINSGLRERDRLLVVDDRSSDRTGEIAAAHGAIVLRREPAEVPGRAAARQAAITYSASLEWDAMVMIDADSIVADGFFDACELVLATGAMAAQARSEAAIGKRLVDQATLASFAIQGVVMPRGRDRLHMLVRLRGTGMILRREIIERFSFRAPASEDLVYSLDLCAAGIRVRHVESARLRSQNAGSWKSATEQKLRYEAGRMAAAREFVGALSKHGGLAGLEAAWFLVSPPFATAVALLIIGLSLEVIAGSATLATLFAGGLIALSAVLLLGIFQARLHPRVFVALTIAPVYLVWKIGVQIRAALAVRAGTSEFGATERHSG